MPLRCGNATDGGLGTVAVMDQSDEDALDRAFARIGIYDRAGRRIKYSEFALLHQNLAYRLLARDTVGVFQLVTAWLGIDQEDGDPPAIFGTAVIGPDCSLVSERFASSETEAVKNHATKLAELQGRTTLDI